MSSTRPISSGCRRIFQSIEIVDSTEHVDRLLPILDEMVTEGLVTMEKVRIVK